MTAGNGTPGYKVTTPPAIREQLRAWGDLARHHNLSVDYIADLKQLNDCLILTPKTFGDPIKDYVHAKLSLYRGLTELLIVVYAVHSERPFVFVQNITLRPDRALGQAEDSE